MMLQTCDELERLARWLSIARGAGAAVHGTASWGGGGGTLRICGCPIRDFLCVPARYDGGSSEADCSAPGISPCPLR
eukprot:4142637-Prymnesium_polylepis.3